MIEEENIPVEEEKKEEPSPVVEEVKALPIIPLVKRVSRSPSPPKPLFAVKVNLNGGGKELNLPDLSNLKMQFVKNVFEEALNDHVKIPIPKCHWAYKLEPASTKVNPYDADFFYITPYIFAKTATESVLKRGLLETIEFREDDNCLSALRMTFNNG